MGIAERREREKAEMRQLILEAAMRLYIRNGYENLSIRQIAEAIEYSPATIYLYFKDKDEILYKLHEDGFDALIRQQEATAKHPNPSDRLTALGEVYVNFALDNPEYYELMFLKRSPMRKLSNGWSCGYASFDIVRATVKDCIDAGQLPHASVEAATIAMWSFVHGLASLIIRDRLRMVPEEQRTALKDQVLDFMRLLRSQA